MGLASGTTTAATESIQLVTPEQLTPLLKETSLRLTAELSSLGFDVLPCDQGDDSEACSLGFAVGRLELTAPAHEIALRCYALNSNEPLSQIIDLSHDEVSAEVVAIRAVELLRGAMLGSLRSRQLRPEQNSAVARFTGSEAEKTPVPKPTTPTSALPPPTDSSARSRSVPLVWQTSLGPLLYLTHLKGPPSFGAQLASELSVGSLYLGGSLELAPTLGQVIQEAGTANLRLYSGFARFGWNADCGPLNCKFGFSVGLLHLQFRAKENDGYLATNAQHESLAVAGETQFAWYGSARWGAFALLRLGALANAPVLAEDDSVTLGQPFGSLALGISFRVDAAPTSD